MSIDNNEITQEFAGIDKIISLTPDSFEEAQQLSQQCPHRHRQWSLYKQALALISFEKWLAQGASSLPVQKENCSVYQPEYAYHLDAVCNLKVGSYKICLLSSLCMSDPEWVLPKAIVDIPGLSAHLYILVGVDEEVEVAAIQGFLLYEQVQALKSSFEPDSEWNYALPISGFNHQTNEIILNLLCLDPIAIPQSISTDFIEYKILKSEIEQLLPQRMEHPMSHPWSWEQLVAILTDSNLRHLVYFFPAKPTVRPLETLRKTAINVGDWINDQINELQDDHGWFRLSSPYRLNGHTSNTLDSYLSEIQEKANILIPQISGCAYHDIPGLAMNQSSMLRSRQTEDLPPVRLYGVTWPLDGEEKWSLLLILDAVPNHLKPDGFTLKVNDPSGESWEKELNQSNPYLHVLLTVDINEIITAEVTSKSVNNSTKYTFAFGH